MSTCIRNNCSERLSRLEDAKEMRLCDGHFKVYMINREKRDIRARRTCLYCGSSISTIRNEKYCNAQHRQLHSRKLPAALVDSITQYSLWRNVESGIKRNPLGLGSIESVNDPIDLFKLYQRKSCHQRSYLLIPKGIDNSRLKDLKPMPLLKLEISHVYPNGKGGLNSPDNVIIAPLIINRMLKDRIPVENNTPYRGRKSSVKPVAVNGGLYKALVEIYGSKHVMDAISSIGHVKMFRSTLSRQPELRSINIELPIFMLLVEEMTRLGYRFEVECLMHLRTLYKNVFPFYLELLSLCFFYAFLTADEARFIRRLLKLMKWFKDEKIKRSQSEIEEHIFLLIAKFLLSFFNVNVKIKQEMIDFYNEHYSLPVVEDEEGGQLICFSYSMGFTTKNVTSLISMDYVSFETWF